MRKNNQEKRYKVSKKILEMFKKAGITEENRTYNNAYFAFLNVEKYAIDETKTDVRYSLFNPYVGKLLFRYISYTEVATGLRKFELDSWVSSYPYLSYELAKKAVIDYISTKSSCTLVKPEHENELERLPYNEEIMKEEVRKRRIDYENER